MAAAIVAVLIAVSIRINNSSRSSSTRLPKRNHGGVKIYANRMNRTRKNGIAMTIQLVTPNTVTLKYVATITAKNTNPAIVKYIVARVVILAAASRSE
jgi:hypothetical protein